jgi:hypothetical protein
MSDANAASSPLPPAPPSSFRAGGCLKVALIGCGALLALFIVAMVFGGLWFRRNRGEFESGAREGARFGMVRDEAACFSESQRLAAEAATPAASLRVGSFLRGCLEYSRPTPGFCENVPSPRSFGQTAAWQQHRCGDNVHCRSVLPVVQTYCAGGRPKRQAADTLLMDGSPGAGGAPGGAGPPSADSGGAAEAPDSASF